MIDPHVHLRDWQQREKETLEHGMHVALRCGIDEAFDMPNTDPPLTNREAILRRLEDARRACPEFRYHLWAGLTEDEKQIRSIVGVVNELYPQVVGLKLFAGHSTGNMGLIDERAQLRVYQILAKCGYDKVVAIHCEKESCMCPQKQDLNDFSSHSLARPVMSEVSSVSDQLRLSEQANFKGHLHICHTSSIQTLALIQKAKARLRRVSCAVTAHHALLSSEDAKKRFLYAKVNPPLRSETERSALFAALLEGRIDWIETDHAPHTLKDKEQGASGLPGFSGLLLLVKALIEAGASDELLSRLLGGAVQELFDLERRAIGIPSYDALERMSEASKSEYPYDSYASLRLR
jgi:dihydroorotase